MSPRPSIELIDSIFQRYQQANKQKKKVILDEFCANHNCHRKSAIRLFNHKIRYQLPKARKRGRPSVYNDRTLIKVIECIWQEAYYPCSKNLKACIILWLPAYEKTFGNLEGYVKKLLLRISPATIDRLLKPVRPRYKKCGRCTTKPGTLLKNKIPIKTEQWNETKPGFIEADTIAHCGEKIEGQYVYTVDAVDIATQWNEQRAVWGKGEAGVFEQIKDMEDNGFPFPLTGFDSDNGGEFINHHLFKYFTGRKTPVQFTRSREYKKNDNAHVEQKNWTHVRQWLGYARFDNPALAPLLNGLYKNEWRLFHNFFHPSVKLIEKKRIGSKTVKRYDKPKAPYQRVMESQDVSGKVKERLTTIFETLNPFELKKTIMLKIKHIRRFI